MYRRLQSAARSGDVDTLHQLLHENPFILSDHVLISSQQNPLTTAIKASQILFVREILKLKPGLAVELDHDGFRPLDVASAYGNVEIVGEILEAVGQQEVCRLGGRDGRTAIHYAAVNGRTEIIDRLMSWCSDSARDVTSFGETTLHLAIKSFKFGAVRSMLQWLDKVDIGLVEMVNWRDNEGNTALHDAVLRKQLEIVQLLLDWNKNNTRQNILELNAPNNKGLTPMDIADILLIESSNNDIRPIVETLRQSGGFTSSEFHILSETPNPIIKNTHRTGEKPKTWIDIVKHFQFQWQRDSPGEARQALLVVAALIATVTFEAGINPPSYLFEASSRSNVTVSGADSNMTDILNEISSNSESSSMLSIIVFLFVNSIALSTAVSVIDYLTVGLPFQRELRVSICSMIFAYGWSLGSTRPTGLVKNILLVVAISMPLFLRLLPYAITKIRSRNKRNGA